MKIQLKHHTKIIAIFKKQWLGSNSQKNCIACSGENNTNNLTVVEELNIIIMLLYKGQQRRQEVCRANRINEGFSPE